MPKKHLVLEGLREAIARSERALNALRWIHSSSAVQDVLDCGQPRQMKVREGLQAAEAVIISHLSDLQEELTWWEAWGEVQAREDI